MHGHKKSYVYVRCLVGCGVPTAMIKLKQLRSRLLLRLSKFDRSVVVNLKQISYSFGIYMAFLK